MMNNPNSIAAAVNGLALAVANQLDDEQLALCAAVLTQLADTLATIAVCRAQVLPIETPAGEKDRLSG